mmetsp:Transcript_34136/g.96731  ORF Transcript_34136/g.96731 Transcript_34136/m.96731 type:complete len:99 (-) Transcript_34136:73-369(-)
MISGAEAPELRDLAAPENRADLRELVRASGLKVPDELLDKLLESLSQGLHPQQLVESIHKLLSNPSAVPPPGKSAIGAPPGSTAKKAPPPTSGPSLRP